MSWRRIGAVRGLLIGAAGLLSASCGAPQYAGPFHPKGDYANASAIGCDVSKCVARVRMKSTCATGPLRVRIWRDTPLRGEPLYDGELGPDQAFAVGEKNISVPVCSEKVEPVQALAFRLDGTCLDDDDLVTAQFSCFR